MKRLRFVIIILIIMGIFIYFSRYSDKHKEYQFSHNSKMEQHKIIVQTESKMNQIIEKDRKLKSLPKPDYKKLKALSSQLMTEQQHG